MMTYDIGISETSMMNHRGCNRYVAGNFNGHPLEDTSEFPKDRIRLHVGPPGGHEFAKLVNITTISFWFMVHK